MQQLVPHAKYVFNSNSFLHSTPINSQMFPSYQNLHSCLDSDQFFRKSMNDLFLSVFLFYGKVCMVVLSGLKFTDQIKISK